MADSNLIRPGVLQLAEVLVEPTSLNFKDIRIEAARNAISHAMNHSNQKIADASYALGVTRSPLHELLERL